VAEPATFSGVKTRPTLPLIVLLVATGCGTARHTAGEGSLQKRRHQPGWHVDLGLRTHSAHTPRTRPPQLLKTRAYEPAISAGEPIAALVTGPGMERRTTAPGQVAFRDEDHPFTTAAPTARTPFAVASATTPSEDPQARWNPWALPAFAVALGTVACAILGTSELLVVLAVIATLVLASIAVRKGRTFEWRGKGFAIAALMIGALAGLITLIALLN